MPFWIYLIAELSEPGFEKHVLSILAFLSQMLKIFSSHYILYLFQVFFTCISFDIFSTELVGFFFDGCLDGICVCIRIDV